jgi:hypothetical protein
MDFTNLPSADGEHGYQIEQQARLRERARRDDAAGVAARADDDSATSPDGAVTVIVGAGGALNDVTFHPKAAELSLLELRTSVLSAYRLGCTRAATRSADAAETAEPAHRTDAPDAPDQ